MYIYLHIYIYIYLLFNVSGLWAVSLPTLVAQVRFGVDAFADSLLPIKGTFAYQLRT